MIRDYEKQVYTGILGKVIGVLLGGPFEGWEKASIQEKWGAITRYVHEDCGKPLVVADDDISGTLTFVRALEDSGLYEKTPDDFFGKTWLNYLIPGKSILWWGGMAHSTEHTAYIRLTEGHPSPESGSMALNGKEVSEQIGAQIFIDGFGLVAPGNPHLAAELAAKAARVSHDGEAVYAAQVVAAMVSLAFVEKEMDRVLDLAIQEIPAGSLIAQVHKDVRQWAKDFPDWNDTFAKISEKYGYQRYGGNCHVIPNHAVMVMAWAYGKNDFHKCLSIASTAGWDTDCNAGNVGSVAALVAGLEHLNDTYDFISPVADQLIIPTAEGYDTFDDILSRALRIADIGRHIMGMAPFPAPKSGARYHFEMPYSQQGFKAADDHTRVRNIPAPQGFQGTRCLEMHCELQENGVCRIETPLGIPMDAYQSYPVDFTPAIYSGNTLRIRGRVENPQVAVRLALRLNDGNTIFSENAEVDAEGNFDLSWTPEYKGIALALGGETTSTAPCTGNIWIDSIAVGGTAHVENSGREQDLSGWISSMQGGREWDFSNETLRGARHFISNDRPGIAVTGDRSWHDIRIAVDFKIHSADRAGVLFDYQGLQRWNGVLFTRQKLQIVHNYYGEKILEEIPFAYTENTPMHMEIFRQGNQITVAMDGETVLKTEESRLTQGAAGFFLDHGLAGYANLAMAADAI